MYCYLTFSWLSALSFFFTILSFSCVVLVLSSLYAFFGLFSAAAFCFILPIWSYWLLGLLPYLMFFYFYFLWLLFLGFVSALLTFLSGYLYFVIDHFIFFLPFLVI
jgi:hypothetical protein